VDVFALGCVLYECLTGAAAFAGEHRLAIRAKVVLADPHAASAYNADVTPALGAALADMLAKRPADRLADAAAVVAALSEAHVGDVGATARWPAAGVDAATRPGRPANVLGATRAATATTDSPKCLGLVARSRDDDAPVAAFAAGVDDEATAPTLELGVSDTVAAHGGWVARLADDSLIVAVAADEPPVEVALRAARCALALRQLFPDAAVAVVTESAAAQTSITAAIDRGVEALWTEALEGMFSPSPATRGVRLDPQTAALLRDRLDISESGSGYYLR
jgi:hypothetical protein